VRGGVAGTTRVREQRKRLAPCVVLFFGTTQAERLCHHASHALTPALSHPPRERQDGTVRDRVRSARMYKGARANLVHVLRRTSRARKRGERHCHPRQPRFCAICARNLYMSGAPARANVDLYLFAAVDLAQIETRLRRHVPAGSRRFMPGGGHGARAALAAKRRFQVSPLRRAHRDVPITQRRPRASFWETNDADTHPQFTP
jgi:hypothetical protein